MTRVSRTGNYSQTLSRRVRRRWKTNTKNTHSCQGEVAMWRWAQGTSSNRGRPCQWAHLPSAPTGTTRARARWTFITSAALFWCDTEANPSATPLAPLIMHEYSQHCRCAQTEPKLITPLEPKWQTDVALIALEASMLDSIFFSRFDPQTCNGT